MGDLGVDPDSAQGSEQLMVRAFGGADLTELRHDVAACAATHGLSGDLLDDFVLAINELATNAVRHGGGAGTLRLWRLADRLECEVSDAGAGIAAGGPRGVDRPSPRQEGGWGLWLARKLSDTMVVTTGPGGTRVRISTPTGG